jgi:hypothetical protein
MNSRKGKIFSRHVELRGDTVAKTHELKQSPKEKRFDKSLKNGRR